MAECRISRQFLQSEPLEAVERLLAASAQGVDVFKIMDEQEIGAAMVTERIEGQDEPQAS